VRDESVSDLPLLTLPYYLCASRRNKQLTYRRETALQGRGSVWSKVEDDIRQTIEVYLQPL